MCTSCSIDVTATFTPLSAVTFGPEFRSGDSRTKTGAIVGGVVGGIAFLAAVILGVFLFLHRMRRRHRRSTHEKSKMAEADMTTKPELDGSPCLTKELPGETSVGTAAYAYPNGTLELEGRPVNELPENIPRG